MAYGHSLEWSHCPDGVELVDLGQPKTSKNLLAECVDPSGKNFRTKTSRRYPIRLSVDDLENPVVLHFVNAQDDKARADFLGRFGFLYKEQVLCGRDELLDYQRGFRKLLTSAGSDEPDGATINKYFRRGLVPVLVGRRLSFDLTDLGNLMLREIVMVVEKDARLTNCQHCGKAFLTGPTTGRRSHAAYCSDRCRVAAMRARNSS